MPSPIPALVVGTGFGCRIHVPALRAAGFAIVGLVGTRPDRLAKKAAEAGIPATFTDLDEAIVQTGARVVTVATPPATHAELSLEAIAHGCHVLCEKPFAFDARRAGRCSMRRRRPASCTWSRTSFAGCPTARCSAAPSPTA